MAPLVDFLNWDENDLVEVLDVKLVVEDQKIIAGNDFGHKDCHDGHDYDGHSHDQLKLA